MNLQFGNNFGGGFGTATFAPSGFLAEIIFFLNEFRILDVILPFLLIFAVIFGILEKTGIFSRDKDGGQATKYNAIIAVAIALIVVVPHLLNRYPDPTRNPVIIISQALPGFALAGIFVILMLLMLGIGGKKVPNSVSRVISLFAVVAILYILYRAIFYQNLPWAFAPLGENPFLVMFIVIVLVIGLIIRGLMAPPAGDEDSFGNTVNRFFGEEE